MGSDGKYYAKSSSSVAVGDNVQVFMGSDGKYYASKSGQPTVGSNVLLSMDSTGKYLAHISKSREVIIPPKPAPTLIQRRWGGNSTTLYHVDVYNQSGRYRVILYHRDPQTLNCYYYYDWGLTPGGDPYSFFYQMGSLDCDEQYLYTSDLGLYRNLTPPYYYTGLFKKDRFTMETLDSGSCIAANNIFGDSSNLHVLQHGYGSTNYGNNIYDVNLSTMDRGDLVKFIDDGTYTYPARGDNSYIFYTSVGVAYKRNFNWDLIASNNNGVIVLAGKSNYVFGAILGVRSGTYHTLDPSDLSIISTITPPADLAYVYDQK